MSKNCIGCVVRERTGGDLLCDECRQERALQHQCSPFGLLMGQIDAMLTRSNQYKTEAEQDGDLSEGEKHARVSSVLKELKRLGEAFSSRYQESREHPAPGWIDVSEQMPSTFLSVIVAGILEGADYELRDAHEAFWDGRNWRSVRQDPDDPNRKLLIHKVSHWMPMPKVP